jgi:hypothetical protein
MDSWGWESKQLEQLGEIEKRLWTGADTLRANSNFASNEYFLPVMGLIFLRHAYSRFLKVKGDIEGNLPTRGGKRRELTKEDFSRKGAIFLREKAQFDYLVSLPDGQDRAKAIIDAMTSIEEDYESRAYLVTGVHSKRSPASVWLAFKAQTPVRLLTQQSKPRSRVTRRPHKVTHARTRNQAQGSKGDYVQPAQGPA